MMDGNQALGELFGVIGPFVILALVVILLIDKLARFITGFKKFKVGNSVVGIETEALGSQDTTAFCPHQACSDARDKVLADLAKSMVELRQSSKDVTAMIHELEKQVVKVHADLKAIFIKVEDISVDQLKLVFYNKEMTYAERIISGIKYIQKGHNRRLKADVIEEVLLHPDVYAAIVTAMPSLRCEEIDKILNKEGIPSNE